MTSIKEKNILFHGKENTATIKKLNIKIDKLRTYKIEITEAKDVLKTLSIVIKRAYKNLQKVELFGRYDYYGTGRYSSYAKKKYIDQALKGTTKINFILGVLDSELSDVYGQYEFFNIFKYQKFIEVFYDCLITDWVMQTKLQNALRCLLTAQDHISRIEKTLSHDLKKADDSIAIISEEKRKYIIESE